MARKFLVNLDLNLNQLLNAILQKLASDPTNTTGDAGRLWFNTAADRVKVQTAAGIKYLMMEGDGTGGDADTLDGEDGSYYLSRANHTGTQTASTISDFDSQVRSSRLDQMAAPTSNVSLNNQRLVSVADPQNAQDAATKAYVDALVQGLDTKASVRALAATNLDLTGDETIDGVDLDDGDRVLAIAQTDPDENGIWIVNTAGAWTRPADFDASGDVHEGAFVFVEEGTSYEASGWVLSELAGSFGSFTTQDWTQFSGAGQITAGNGLTKSGNQLDVGAGTGVTVGADSVSIDTAVVVRKYSANVGDGVEVAYVINHGLGTRDVTVGVYLNSGTYEEVEVDVEHTDANNVTLRFAAAPAANAYRVVVHG